MMASRRRRRRSGCCRCWWTLYCKCLVLVGDEAAYGAQLEALLSGAGSNECVVAECELLLKQSQQEQRLAWLVRLYESNGQHKAALARKRAETPSRRT